MSNGKPERRSGQRRAVRVPVTVKPSDGAAQIAHTRDLSANGIFFYADTQIAEGTQLDMVLILPSELTHGEKRWMCCQASVVRVEGRADQGYGVAATIQKCDVLPEIPE